MVSRRRQAKKAHKCSDLELAKGLEPPTCRLQGHRRPATEIKGDGLAQLRTVDRQGSNDSGKDGTLVEQSKPGGALHPNPATARARSRVAVTQRLRCWRSTGQAVRWVWPRAWYRSAVPSSPRSTQALAARARSVRLDEGNHRAHGGDAARPSARRSRLSPGS